MRGAVAIDFNPKAVRVTREGYGTVVDWTQEAAHRWTAIGYPRAALIFDAQKALYQFLRLVVTRILQGVEGSGNAEKWNELVRNGFEDTRNDHFGSVYLSAPFSAPPTFDIRRLLSIARSRLQAAEDTLELLQTDPAYVQHILDERTSTTYSRSAVNLRSTWDTITKDVMVMAVQTVRQWDMMLERCNALAEALDSHRDNSSAGKMPAECGAAYQTLEGWIWTCEERYAEELEAMLYGLRLFQDEFTYGKKPDGEITCTPDLEKNTSRLFFESPMLWAALMHIGSVRDDISTAGLHDSLLVSGFIDDWVQGASKEERRKVDRRFYDHITEMGAVHEMRELVTYRSPEWPWPLKTLADFQQEINHRLAWRATTEDISIYSTGNLPMTIKSFGPLLKEFYDVKWPKGPRNAKWLDQANKSRESLNKFWEEVREYNDCLFTAWGVSEEEIKLDMARTSAATTPEHVAVLLQERNTILQHEAQARQPSSIVSNFSTLRLSDPSEPKLEIPQHRAQPKKRRNAMVPSSSKQEASNPAVQPLNQDQSRIHLEKIAVSRDSLRVFARMFPSGIGATEKQTLRWQSLVTALVDAGCSAEPGIGSAVSFRRSRSAGGGCIVLHRPHPEPNVDPVMLQTFGKRFRKRFGWDGEMFEERGKDTT